MDTIRVELLDNLWYQYAYNEPKTAIGYAKKAIKLSKEINYDKGYVRGYQRLGIAYSNISEYDSSNIAYDKALKIYKVKNKTNKMGIILYNKAINFKDLVKYDSALHYNNLSKLKYIEAKDTIRIADIYSLKGSIYYEKGQFLLALENMLKEASIYKSTDTLRYADAILSIARVQSLTGSSKDAKKSFKECIEIYKKNNDNYFLSKAYREVGDDYFTNKPIKLDSAAFYLEKAIAVAQSISNKGLEVAALSINGDLKLETGQTNKAKEIFEKGLTIARPISHINIASMLLGLSEVSLINKEYNKALNYANEGLTIATENNLNQDIREAYLILFKINKSKLDYKNALGYFEKYKQVNDSLFNIEKTNKINELQTLFGTERKEAEIVIQNEQIKTLNQEVKISKLTKTLYGIGMFSFIAIAGLLYFGFKQRIRKNKIAREKQDEIYKQEIAFKKKELTSQTLHLVQKSTFINELKDNLEKIKKSPELFKVEFRRLVMLLKKESAEDKDWEVFKSYFSEVHNNFDNKIKTISKDITEKEIRLASFLRMNLSTKEIASMLNVLPDSVLKSKYRLKKKLNLDKEIDLTEFLNSL